MPFTFDFGQAPHGQLALVMASYLYKDIEIFLFNNNYGVSLDYYGSVRRIDAGEHNKFDMDMTNIPDIFDFANVEVVGRKTLKYISF